MKTFTVVCEFNGKAIFDFVVSALDARDAIETAKTVIGHRYELRVIT